MHGIAWIQGQVSPRLRACETASVLGGSGSGKTTLLKLIAGLIKPERGRIFLFGQDSVPLSERQLLSLRRRMGVVFQGAALFDSLTVRENVAFPLKVHTKTREREIQRRIEDRHPAELSGGMKKRVGIARALVLQPDLVLFDEPTAGLDPSNARLICELIAELRRELCATSVVVTHDLQCAFTMSNQITFLHNGKIIEVAPPEDFRHSSRPEVQKFLEGALRAFLADPTLYEDLTALLEGAQRSRILRWGIRRTLESGRETRKERADTEANASRGPVLPR